MAPPAPPVFTPLHKARQSDTMSNIGTYVPRPLFYYYLWTHHDVEQTGSNLNRVATVEAVFIVSRFCSIFLFKGQSLLTNFIFIRYFPLILVMDSPNIGGYFLANQRIQIPLYFAL